MSHDIERRLPESVVSNARTTPEVFRFARLPAVLRSRITPPSRTTLAILGLTVMTFLAVRDYSNLYNTVSETLDIENPSLSLQSIKDQDSEWRNYLGEAEYNRSMGNTSLAISLYLRDSFVKEEMEKQFGARKAIDEATGKASVVGILGLAILKSLGLFSKRNNPIS